MAAASILVADHDASSRELLAGVLRRAGYEAIEAATGIEALAAMVDAEPELVILEVDLPEMSGYDVCHALRDRFGETLPILFLSDSRTEPLDRVAGLLIGGDDYLVKPVAAMELLARIRRALIRSNGFARKTSSLAAS
jgi:two-component system OmpR family response regulator